MPSVFAQLVELAKELLVDAVMANMTSLFDMVNSKVLVEEQWDLPVAIWLIGAQEQVAQAYLSVNS